MPLPAPIIEKQKPLCFTTKCIKSIGDDAFVFHCVARYHDTYVINRNMIVLKKTGQDGKPDILTLVNPILLTPAGEKALLRLGKVRHIIRLGNSCHFYNGAAIEDKYYLSKFPNCRRWAPGKLSSCPGLPVHKLLKKGAELPHPDCRSYVLKSTREPEAILLLRREMGGSILITGDCLQHQVDNAFVNAPTLARLKMAGLLKDQVVVSKDWLKAMTPPNKGRDAIQQSLETMAKAKFHRFISTSGNVMLKQQAKRGVENAIYKAFATTAKNTTTAEAPPVVAR